FFFFFFQAEDGIRDRTVTGVQTCALPISRSRNFASIRSTYVFGGSVMCESAEMIGLAMCQRSMSRVEVSSTHVQPVSLQTRWSRSEERRVGKEGRGGWGGGQGMRKSGRWV